jgi:threonine aldolase
MINLHLSRPPLEPSSFFIELSRHAEELGVEKQDIYGDFQLDSSTSWLRKFETEVSDYCGLQNGLFLPSGCMATGIVLAEKGKTSESKSFICHYSSHLLLHENNAYSELLGMSPIIVESNNEELEQKPLLYSQVSSFLDLSPTPAILILECPHREIGGKCTPYSDLLLISEHCRRKGIWFHMDGARLWEATAFYDVSVHQLCSLFDSIYLSFYKGLGGITGAMLLGNNSFIESSRIWSRRFGGNVYSHMPNAVSCWAGFRANRDSFLQRRNALHRIVTVLMNMLSTSDPSIASMKYVYILELSLLLCLNKGF